MLEHGFHIGAITLRHEGPRWPEVPAARGDVPVALQPIHFRCVGAIKLGQSASKAPNKLSKTPRQLTRMPFWPAWSLYEARGAVPFCPPQIHGERCTHAHVWYSSEEVLHSLPHIVPSSIALHALPVLGDHRVHSLCPPRLRKLAAPTAQKLQHVGAFSWRCCPRRHLRC